MNLRPAFFPHRSALSETAGRKTPRRGPRLRLGALLAAFIVTTATAARADVAEYQHDSGWVLLPIIAFFLLLFGAFVFLVKPPREM